MIIANRQPWHKPCRDDIYGKRYLWLTIFVADLVVAVLRPGTPSGLKPDGMAIIGP